MQKCIKKKEPNRSLAFVHDLRRAKEASQKQMVASSPEKEKTALVTALLHSRHKLQIPHLSTLQHMGGTGNGWRKSFMH